MKLSANESLHRTEHEMVCDRKFFGCFTPGENPQNSSHSKNDVIIHIFGAFAGGKAAENIFVSYHFVISAM